ncbi:MAG: cupredoxin domain-containing protein, partial [Nanoarchaeota archaeon]|nr:cupredoxin domain-containing protein [Nanoarchaeota archaeon]
RGCAIMKKFIGLLMVLLVLTACSATVEQSSTVSNNQDNDNSKLGDIVTSDVKEFTIIANDFDFSPASITVKQGDKVRFIVTSAENNHGFAIREYDINVAVNEGESKTVELVADKKGTFNFFCSVFCGSGHKEMKGVFIVE